jgi:hypothetical protein
LEDFLPRLAGGIRPSTAVVVIISTGARRSRDPRTIIALPNISPSYRIKWR